MSVPPRRRFVHAACMGVIALLYVFSVPWYRETDAPLRLWFGLPDWVAVALLCYVGVAVVNAIAWLLTDVPDDVREALEGEATGRATGGRDPGERR